MEVEIFDLISSIDIRYMTKSKCHHRLNNGKGLETDVNDCAICDCDSIAEC